MSGAVVLLHPTRAGQTLDQEQAAAAIRARGYHAVYRLGLVNHCPGCGRAHWHVGRVTAECAFCATALLIVTHFPGKDT